MRGSTDWRLRLVQRLPVALLQAPFECIVAAFALLSGTSQALGLARSVSLSQLFPPWFGQLYGAVLMLASLSLLVGLRRGGGNSPTARGLRLCGSAVTVYGLAVLTVLGLGGLPSGLLFLLIGALCELRAFVITTSRRALREIVTVAEQ